MERRAESDTPSGSGKKKRPTTPRPRTHTPGKEERLSFNERREREGLPDRIEALEEELGKLHERMAAPEFFKGDPEAIRRATERSRDLQEEIDALYARWAELDR